MPFDPDQYLAQQNSSSTGFNPDSYLKEKGMAAGQPATDIQPETKDKYLGIHFGGSPVTSSTIAEGPTWEQAQKRLIDLENQGVSKDDPRYKQALKDKALGLQRLTGSAAEGFSLLGGVSAGGVVAGKGIPLVAGKISDIAGAVTGKTAKDATQSLRSDVMGEAEKQAAQYKARLDSIEKAQKQLSEREPTAESRATAQALKHDAFHNTREEVRQNIVSRMSELQKEHEAAGASTQVAKMLAEQSEQRIIDAENGVSQLEKELLARPGISSEEFGGMLQKLTQDLSDKYEKIRSEQAGFGKAIDSAGNYQRVDTRQMIAKIDQELKGIRNDALEATLNRLKEQLTSDGRPALTLKSADSLRKTLDSIVQTKGRQTATGPMAVDKETVHFVSQIKKDLVKAAADSWQPYREALGKFRVLSRPLDIVERKGALKRVIDTDPMSTDYTMAKAQVVGEVLQKARQGNPVFTRLIQESPELRDSARLYFTQDLFGKEAVPSEASLRTWLKNNESSLKQLGLYDDFKDIKTAKNTAQRAVDEAKQARDMSKDELKKHLESEKSIGDKLKAQSSLRQRMTERMAAADKAVPTKEDILEKSASRAKEAGTRLEGSKAKSGALEKRYSNFHTDLDIASAKDIVPKSREFIKSLRKNDLIDDAKYRSMMSRVDQVEKTEKRAADIKKAIKLIVGGSAVITAGDVIKRAAGF